MTHSVLFFTNGPLAGQSELQRMAMAAQSLLPGNAQRMEQTQVSEQRMIELLAESKQRVGWGLTTQSIEGSSRVLAVAGPKSEIQRLVDFAGR